MRLSKRVKRNIERESLRIKAIYEAPNAELDKLKEATKNRAIQIIQEIIDTNEADAREKLKNFNKKDKL